MTRPYEWTLSGLDLTEPDDLPASGFWFKHYGENWNFGSPGDDPRLIEFTVAVCGYSIDDLHAGERVLAQVAQTDTQGKLEFLPPVSGSRTLYWVKSSRMVAAFDDLQILDSGVKYIEYRVTLSCDPLPYSETVTTETFTPGTATITPVDTASANTNWPGTTVVSYLGETAVRLGPIAAVQGAVVVGDSPGFRYWTMDPGYVVDTYIDFTGSITSGTYMYLDFAGSSTGVHAQFGAPYIKSGDLSPIASQILANGYTRYFYPRRAGALKIGVYAGSMVAGDTASFHINEIGSADVLPSGSLFVLNSQASVSTEATFRISRSANGLGEVLVYADPSMLTHGWNPAQAATWANAPEGDYWVYFELSSYVAGDNFSVTIGGQTLSNRMDADSASETRWMPFGPFTFGGRKSRRLGTVSGLGSVALFKNGVSLGTVTTMRLFRKHRDATLTHAWLNTTSAGNTLWIEPQSIDAEHAGVYVGSDTTGVDATMLAPPSLRSWSTVKVAVPTTAVFVQSDATTTPIVSVTRRLPGHTFAPGY